MFPHPHCGTSEGRAALLSFDVVSPSRSQVMSPIACFRAQYRVDVTKITEAIMISVRLLRNYPQLLFILSAECN
jgi:hypothetical protein